MSTAITPSNTPSPPKPAQLTTSHAGETLLLNAHNEWRTRPADQRFESLDALTQALQARRDRSRTLDIAPKDIRVEPAAGDNIIFGHGQMTSRPNNWSFGQFCQLVGAKPGYLATLPAPIITDALRFGLNQRRTTEGEAKKVRLMMTDREDSESTN